MKNILFSLLILTGSSSLIAQQSTVDTVLVDKQIIRNGLNTTVINTTLTTSVEATYKSQVNWAALPVVATDVPVTVANAIKGKYSATIYDIRKIKGTSGNVVYVVRVLDNGAYRTDYVGEDGNLTTR